MNRYRSEQDLWEQVPRSFVSNLEGENTSFVFYTFCGVVPGAIIGDGDRKRALLLVLGLPLSQGALTPI